MSDSQFWYLLSFIGGDSILLSANCVRLLTVHESTEFLNVGSQLVISLLMIFPKQAGLAAQYKP